MLFYNNICNDIFDSSYQMLITFLTGFIRFELIDVFFSKMILSRWILKDPGGLYFASKHFKKKKFKKKMKSKLNRFITWIETPLFPCHPIKCTIRQNPGPRAPFRHTHTITTRNQNGGFGGKKVIIVDLWWRD